MQKYRQNDSFKKQNSAFSRKNNVKIKILQSNFQFDDFFRENNEFYCHNLYIIFS